MRTHEKFLPHRVHNPPPPYPWLATLKIVKGMRVLFGTKATVYSKQSGSYGPQSIQQKKLERESATKEFD